MSTRAPSSTTAGASPRARWLALALGLALGAALLAGGLRLVRRAPAELVEVQGDRARLLALFEARARAGPPPSAPARLVVEPLREADARELFPQLVGRSAAAHEFDPHVGYRLRGGLERRVPFAEHPRGRIRVRTNSLGLRMDAEPAAAKPDLRVLVVGDSHTEGACDNDETFCARLEQLLRERLAPRTVEVLNAGRAGWSFYQYLGALESYRALAPDVCVLAAYEGNDFYESLLLHHWFQRTPLVEPPPEPEPAVPSGAWTQWLRQLVHLEAHPEEAERALQAALWTTRAFAVRCAERGIRPLVVLLPAQAEARPQDCGADLAALERRVGLDSGARARLAELLSRWLAGLRADGIETLDLRASFRAAPERLFWPLDGHLDLAGNALVARELAARLAP